MTRVLEPAGIIQAWGDLNDPDQRGRTIIDSLMNTPLLFWASETSGDRPLRRRRAPARRPAARPHPAARRHHLPHLLLGPRDRRAAARRDRAGQRRRLLLGARAGVGHLRLQPQLPLHRRRRRSWTAAQRCADYFLAHLPADDVAYWDLVFGDGSGEERDSSAAAIAACGLIELAGQLPDGARADRLPRRRRPHPATRSSTGTPRPRHPESNALLLHGVYDKPKGVGVDEGNLWGDYFYLEALTRVTRPDWTGYW